MYEIIYIVHGSRNQNDKKHNDDVCMQKWPETICNEALTVIQTGPYKGQKHRSANTSTVNT